MHFLLLPKLTRVLLKKNVMRLHYSIDIADIWTCAKYPYQQLPLVSSGYPCLPSGYII